uniref:Uncharacterized protein n=1 Tax=Anguilla anguilla TaxID=7936 RepID=A0A0E9WP59_ANGAN
MQPQLLLVKFHYCTLDADRQTHRQTDRQTKEVNRNPVRVRLIKVSDIKLGQRSIGGIYTRIKQIRTSTKCDLDGCKIIGIIANEKPIRVKEVPSLRHIHTNCHKQNAMYCEKA